MGHAVSDREAAAGQDLVMSLYRDPGEPVPVIRCGRPPEPECFVCGAEHDDGESRYCSDACRWADGEIDVAKLSDAVLDEIADGMPPSEPGSYLNQFRAAADDERARRSDAAWRIEQDECER